MLQTIIMAAKKKSGLAAALAREQQKVQQAKKNNIQNHSNNKHKINKHETSGLKRVDNHNKNKIIEEQHQTKSDTNEDTVETKQHEEINNEISKESAIDTTLKDTNDNTLDINNKPKFVPFKPTDKILLVGEGDFSFSRSILESGLARYVKATNLDSKNELIKKYQDTVEKNIEFLENYVIPPLVEEIIVVDKKEEEKEDNDDLEEEEEQQKEIEKEEENDDEDDDDDDVKYNFKDAIIYSSAESNNTNNNNNTFNERSVVVDNSKWNSDPLYNIDATKLHKNKTIKQLAKVKCGNKKKKKNNNDDDDDESSFDVIMFNFPHTGAGINDQNRNVIAHQKLMISFFKSCLGGEGEVNNTTTRNGNRNQNHNNYQQSSILNPQNGTIVVTLFNGLPYDLWNIRSLAKECGLTVRQSGTFNWSQYPGYSHRLTTGTGDTNKKSQTREARTYVFERLNTRKMKEKLKLQEVKRQQNKALQAMKNSLKGKKGKRKLAQLIKKQKSSSSS